MTKKKRSILIISAVVVVGAFIALAAVKNQEKLIPVTVEAAETGKIVSIVTANGKVEAEKKVNISADVMGRIVDLPVVEGDYVKKGQLLLEIDRTQPEADAAQARASLASARVNQEEAQLNYDRQKGLHDRDLISQAEFDLARTNLDKAKASVNQAQAYLDRAMDQLDKCTIRAPMAGTITTLNSEEGENVIIGTMNNAGTVIMVISDLSEIVVKADVDETDIARLALAQDVKISLDAFPDTTFNGRVTEIGNAAKVTGTYQEQVTNFEVTVLITDDIPNIKPGMNATVDITTDTRDGVVKIPIQAVVMRNPEEEKMSKGEKEKSSGSEAEAGEVTEENKTVDKEAEKKEIEGVFVIKGDAVEFTPVKTGISDQQYIEIQSGLDVGQKVVTGSYKTLRSLRQGDKVKPKEAKFYDVKTTS